MALVLAEIQTGSHAQGVSFVPLHAVENVDSSSMVLVVKTKIKKALWGSGLVVVPRCCIERLLTALLPIPLCVGSFCCCFFVMWQRRVWMWM